MYVAKLSFLKQPIISLIRVKNPIVLNEKSAMPIRYFLFVLGSTTCTSTTELQFIEFFIVDCMKWAVPSP